MINVVIIAAALAWGFVTLGPERLHSKSWRATVTPLASIIGSGFLVAGPILGHVAGDFAVLAMAGLCALAYLFGAAIRFNIRHVEPALADHPTGTLSGLNLASHFSLAFAYFISVAYYLNLFAAFVLKGAGIVDPLWTEIIATIVIVTLGIVGFTRGLKSLENVELIAVGIKLALIGGVVAGLAYWAARAAITGAAFVEPVEHVAGFHAFRVLLGLVILVQGFETSRYLDEAYDQTMRIRSMRRAQWIATAVYVVYIIAVTPHLTGSLPAAGGETQIIDMLRPLAVVIAPAILLTAVASQISAAVADMNGASGLLADYGGEKLNMRWGYAITAAAALGVTWAANIFEIITWASKAFVLFYGLQSVTTLYTAIRLKKGSLSIIIVGTVGVIAALAVIFLGVPAEGG